MKIIKVPVYETLIKCDHCGFTLPDGIDNNRHRFGGICCVCKKEGCDECLTWLKNDDKKNKFHEDCHDKLPKSVLKKEIKIDEEHERQEEAHREEYPIDNQR